MNAISRFLCLAMLAMSAIACLFVLGGSLALALNRSSKHETSVYAVIDKVPEKACAKHNPLENDPDAAAAGGKLFERHCAECHGMKADGTKRAPSLLKSQVRQAPAGAIFWILTNGVVRRGMPDWSKLPEAERWQIVTFLKSFRSPGVSQSSVVPR